MVFCYLLAVVPCPFQSKVSCLVLLASAAGTREARLGNVGLIVFDEVHYLGDPDRGSVWEEAIINCPRHIQMLCMSATVKNPDDLGGWISKVPRSPQLTCARGYLILFVFIYSACIIILLCKYISLQDRRCVYSVTLTFCLC